MPRSVIAHLFSFYFFRFPFLLSSLGIYAGDCLSLPFILTEYDAHIPTRLAWPRFTLWATGPDHTRYQIK